MSENEATVVEEAEVVEEEAVVEVEAAPEPTEEEIFKAEAMTPQEAAKELGGETKGFSGRRIRRDIRAEVCPARKIGGRWFCSLDHLHTYLTNLEARASAKVAKKAAAAAAAEAKAEVPEAPVVEEATA